jgi:hypothetical protein
MTQTIEEIAVEAAEWAADLFEKRTREVAAGTASIYYVHPAYRVSWMDTYGKFPELKGPTGRIAFQEPFNKAIKKRKLWQVLQGKMKSDVWVAKHPTKDP